ncbi:PilZ domain-containing protein [Desulfobulbus propionicus]
MEKKRWNDIPSLEGLKVDWQYSPDCRDGKRVHKRLTSKDFRHLFGSHQVTVKLASTTATVEGTLRDLSEGGLGVDLKTHLDEARNLKVGLMLGQEKIIASAQVRHIRAVGNQYVAGLQFINLEPAIRSFIAGMYTSKVLRHGL